MLVSRHQPPRAHQPGEDTLDQPASTITTQRASIDFASARWPRSRSQRRNQFGAALGELGFEWGAVIRLVADQAEEAASDEALAKRFLDELSFMARTTRDPNGDRSTASVCNCHDLGCWATARNSDESAPLLAPA